MLYEPMPYGSPFLAFFGESISNSVSLSSSVRFSTSYNSSPFCGFENMISCWSYDFLSTSWRNFVTEAFSLSSSLVVS